MKSYLSIKISPIILKYPSLRGLVEQFRSGLGTSSIKVIKLECTIAKRRNIYEKCSKAETTGWITPQWLWGKRRGSFLLSTLPIRGHRCRLEMYMHFNTLKFAPRYIYRNIVWLPRTNRVFHPSIFRSQISLSSPRLYSADARRCISRIFFYIFLRTHAAVRVREIVFIFYDAFALRSLIPIKGIEIIL